MASWIPASARRRLLRYVLSQAGLLDTEALDLENLGLQFGRSNNVELRNVGFHLDKLSALLQLPPNVRLVAARVLLLRLTVPANFFQQSIVAQVDGIDVQIAIDEPVQPHEPQHRKTNRRLHSPPPPLPDPGGRVPSTHQLAQSFLQDEPPEEKQELEARYMAKSSSSDASEEGAVGTGTALGLPAALAGFIQGIMDRVQIHIKDVNFRLSHQDVASEEPASILAARVASIDVGPATATVNDHVTQPEDSTGKQRSISIQGFSVHLLCKEQPVRETDSPFASFAAHMHNPPAPSQPPVSPGVSDDEPTTVQETDPLPPLSPPIRTAASVPETEDEDDDFGDVPNEMTDSTASFGIRPGEDNISWTSRRSRGSSDHEQLWSSFSPEEQPSASDILQDMSSSMFLSSFDTRQSPEATPHARSPVIEPSKDILTSSSSYQRTYSSVDSRDPQAEGAEAETRDSPTLTPDLTPIDEPDMTQSIVYSHAEAESMYMSATSHEPGSPNLSALPGGWNSTLDDIEESDPPFLSQHIGEASEYDSDRAPTPRLSSHIPAPQETHEQAPPTDDNPGATQSNYVSKNIIAMRHLTVRIRESSSLAHIPESTSHDTTGSSSSMGFSTFHHQAPGAFSVYAEGARSSVRFHSPHEQEDQTTQKDQPEEKKIEQIIELDAGPVDLQADGNTLGLLYQLTKLIVPDNNPADGPSQKSSPNLSKPLPRFILRLDALYIKLFHTLPETIFQYAHLKSWRPSPPQEDDRKPLVQVEVRMLDAQSTTTSLPLDGTLSVGKFVLTAGTNDIVFFDSPPGPPTGSRASRRDITINLRSRTTIQRQTVREVDARTLPLHVNLDLAKFDEDFSSLGGLSGIVEMSSSVLSNGSSSNKSNSPPPQRRGVRFEEENMSDLSNSPQLKINARIDGFNATLTAKTCCLELRASRTKLVYREKAIAAVIDNADFCMPSPSVSAARPDFDVRLGNVSLYYLFSPDTKDLERLLSLLTPSKDKYESDDDILIDTLLNQRRKGAVMRVQLSTFQTHVTDWTFVSYLQQLGEELTKLSAVTKYLPEDDRPGVLLLVSVADSRIQIPLNESFGFMDISLKDFQAAQVGLPALFALSVGSVRVAPAGGDAIIHELLPSTSPEPAPMFMARMLGDEAEPVARVKLFNTCVEYSVPTLLALTGTNSSPEAEQKVQDLAASVLDMSGIGFKEPMSPQSPASPSKASDHVGRKLAIDVLLHECALGLKPRDLDAKGLVFLKNTKLTTIVPPEESLEATLEIREASLYLADQEQDSSPGSLDPRVKAYQPDSPHRLHSHFLARGYTSVSSMRSAKAIVCVTEDKLEKTRYVDVELRNEFFLLETCADSTQTLIAVLNGLSPPMPVSNEPKFRTETDVMTLDEMVNSLSGDAFVRPGPAPSALFDTDEDLPLPEDDDLLVESDMTSSLYGPVDATIDVEDDFYGGDGLESDTVESLLDQDPFEITSSPQLGDDALLHSLKKQLANANSGKPVSIKPFFVDDKQLDKIYGGSRVLGEAQEQDKRFPIQVRVRDVNVIWNLYDGYDWQKTRDAISQAVEQVEMKLEEKKANRRRSTDYEDEEEAVIGDCLFNSIYIGVASARDPSDLRHQINQGIDVASETESYATSGISRPTQASANRQTRLRHKKRLRLQRSKSHKLGFELKGVSLDFLVHPAGTSEIQSSVDVRITDFDIFDHIPTSTWRKFLTFYNDENNMREMMKPIIHIELLNIRPVPELAATEMTIQASVLPLRLHVDQDALEFMTRFFDFKDNSLKPPDPNAEQPFIQRLEVNTVHLVLDYKPKKVDYGGLRSGRMSEFKNFVILDTAHIQLKHAIVYGLRGFDTLHDTLSDIWTPDVIQHQLRGVLAGIGPVRPFVSLGAGVRDVVAIPVREYRKDGRLVRSVQKGAFHFAKTTTSELARLGAKIAIGTQTMLQGAEDMLSPASASPGGPSRGLNNAGLSDVEEEYEESQRVVSNYADQPLSVLQGLRSARRYLERDLLTARDAFIAVQGELLDSGSAVGAAQAVARHAPTIVLRPVIGASRAVGQTLMGVGNQVDRANVRKIEDKYKRR